MNRKIRLLIGVGLISTAVLLLLPRWYASHDARKEKRALSARKDARGKEAWKGYSQMPWIRLMDVDGRFREAAKMVILAMDTEGLNQEDYRVRVVQWPDSDSYDFTLLHVREFELEREGKHYFGDPCGKCRVASYNPKNHTLSRLYKVQ